MADGTPFSGILIVYGVPTPSPPSFILQEAEYLRGDGFVGV